jgi:hypothetical protein
MANTKIQANDLDFRYISWKSYNLVKKKAMEQKFSWSGLLLSLSIAFLIVLISAQGLNLLHQLIVKKHLRAQQKNYQIYHSENIKNDSANNNYSLKNL